MNEILKVESYNITFTIQNVTEFCLIFKGTLKREKFVPFLSDEKNTQTVEWYNEIQLMMKQYNDFYPCPIDEKWFYTSSGKNKEKTTPTVGFVTEEEIYIPQKSTCSRIGILQRSCTWE